MKNKNVYSQQITPPPSYIVVTKLHDSIHFFDNPDDSDPEIR